MDVDALKGRLDRRVPGLMDCERFYAVLVPLIEREGQWYVLYEVRSLNMRHQPGEVCFPGGKMERGEGPEQCALRETWEELGIPRQYIRILGRLDFLAHRANFLMQPVLAQVDESALEEMRLNPDEVEETFLVPLSHLMDKDPLEYEYPLNPAPKEDFPFELIGIPKEYAWQPGRENVPVYQWQGHVIWGLTGRITRNMAGILRAN